jgi:hypothetical protein
MPYPIRGQNNGRNDLQGGLYLEVDRISSGESISCLFDGIMGMPIKDIEVGDPLFVEERPSHATMESDIHMSAGGNDNSMTGALHTSTYHLE